MSSLLVLAHVCSVEISAERLYFIEEVLMTQLRKADEF